MTCLFSSKIICVLSFMPIQIQILANSSNPVSGFWEPFLPYTTIPLACPTPGSKSIIVPYTTGNSSYPTVTVLPNHKEKTGGLSKCVISK